LSSQLSLLSNKSLKTYYLKLKLCLHWRRVAAKATGIATVAVLDLATWLARTQVVLFGAIPKWVVFEFPRIVELIIFLIPQTGCRKRSICPKRIL
jgi:hypothetical protein